MRPALVLLALVVGLVLTTSAAAHPGWGIVVDRQGQIYFTDLASIWKIDAQGRVARVVAGKHSHALYLDEASNLYGEHLTYERARKLWWTSLWKLAPDGMFSDVIPPVVGVRSLLPRPVDPQGNSYFWEGSEETRQSRLYKKTPDGNITALAGSEWGQGDGAGAQAKFGRVNSLTIGPGSVLYLIDGTSVRKVMPDGTTATLARNLVRPNVFFDPAGGGRFNRLMSLAVDATGNVYVANYGNRCVLKITPAGRVSTLLRTSWLWSPSGVTVAEGAVYVLESAILPPGWVHVRRVGPDGKPTTLANTSGIWGAVTVVGAPLVPLALVFSAALWKVRLLRHRRAFGKGK